MTLSERIIYELAAARNVSPVELEEPLNDTVDPDALDALFAPRLDGSLRASEGSVVFSSNGFRVVVRANGDVRLESPTEPPA